MKHSETQNRLIYSYIATIGIFFYLYYAIYKMLLFHLSLLGRDYAYTYIAIQNFFNGSSLYVMPHGHPPLLYAPFSVLIYLPLNFFSLNQAIILWFILTQALILFCACILYKIGSQINKTHSAVAAIIAICFSMPLFGIIFSGNTSIVMLAGFCIVYYSIALEREKTVPFVLALLAYFKIFPTSFILVYVRHQAWREIFYLVGFLVLLGLLSLCIFGMEEHILYLNQLPKGLKYLSPTIYNASFAFVLNLFFPQFNSLAITIVTAIWGIILLVLWWFVADRHISHVKSASQLADALIVLVFIFLVFPASSTMSNAFLMIPFYFIIFLRLQNNCQFHHFFSFILLFCLINFWEIIIYQLPIPGSGSTIKAIAQNSREHPILYPMLYSLPFLFNLVFYAWLLVNYRTISLAIYQMFQRKKGAHMSIEIPSSTSA